MKKSKLVLALCFLMSSSMAFADKPALLPPQHHKRHKKVVVLPPVNVLPPAEVILPTPKVVIVPPVVIPPVLVVAPKKACKTLCPPESNNFVPSLHLGIGVGVQNPYASGFIGLRLEFPKVYLGIEPFASIPYGVGVDALVYAYRGRVVQLYPLSVGFMLDMGGKYLSDQDIHRLVDLRLGAGLSIKVACHVLIALDWRVSIPDPVKLSKEDGVCQHCGESNGSFALDGKNAVRNALAQSQIVLGILVR